MKAEIRITDRTYGPGIITAQLQQIGQQAPYFSLTASFQDAGGCMHEVILKHRPSLAPLKALHLSTYPDGRPMHALENGWYWLAGVHQFGERFHGQEDGRTALDCLAILADHLRIDQAESARIAQACYDVYLCNAAASTHGEDHARQEAKRHLAAYVTAQAPRWQHEAQAGADLIKQLAERKITNA